MTADASNPEHLDVRIVGAGLSGIGAGHYLQAQCRWASWAIFEARDAIGGTWDLFRYPGVRSDSDMFTLGYAFRPWDGAKAIADGASILAYIQDTAAAAGIGGRHPRLPPEGPPPRGAPHARPPPPPPSAPAPPRREGA